MIHEFFFADHSPFSDILRRSAFRLDLRKTLLRANFWLLGFLGIRTSSFCNLLVFSVQISSFRAIKVLRLHFFGASADKAKCRRGEG